MRIGISIFLLLVVYTSSMVNAQESEVRFPSSELQQMSLKYTGDVLNWPILVSISDHDISSNTFSLSSSDVLQLQNFSTISSNVTLQNNRIKTLIASGATIFAKEQLDIVNGLTNGYISSVREGDIEQAIEIGNSIKPNVDLLESTLNDNRLVLVQAQLTQKEGNVDKRLGLLGSWEDAFKGDLFKESDGLRTLAESFASLAFTDGSSILVDPNTVAVIRKSRIDKLDESSDTEISLVEGGLLAKLSAAGKERSKYILNAGTSQSELKTQNFYAESDGDATVKLSNYDGQANITANDVAITIRKNEGTIVRDGQAPLPPIQLLPAPGQAWASSDTIIYRESILYPFQAVENAVSYLIQYSTSSSFDGEINEISLTSTSAQLEDLELGTNYVRVLAIDNLGLRGPFSEPVRVIRNIDNKPPALFVDGLDGKIIFTLDSNIQVTGVTEPETRLTANGQRIPVQVSGRFIISLQNLVADQSISLSAIDASGNETQKTIRVVRLTEAELFNFSLNGATGTDVLTVTRPTVTISSSAYPEMEVIIINGGNERKVLTDSRGRWGITMSMQEGKLSVTFRDITTGKYSLTKSFIVQAN